MVRRELVPWAPLPYAVLERTDVPATSKLVFAVLAKLDPTRAGVLRISHPRLARLLGTNERTVRRAVRKLERATLLEVIRAAGQICGYRLVYANLAGAASGDPGQNVRGDPGQMRPPPRTDCPGTPDKLSAPLARESSSDTLSRPRGVPPLLWEAALTALRNGYAGAFPGGMPPSRWYERLAAELNAGNIAIVDQLDADAMQGGLGLASAARRSYGFGWVVNYVQQRHIAIASRDHGSTEPDTTAADAAREREAANADQLARTRAYWNELPEATQLEQRAEAAQVSRIQSPEVLEAMAIELAWRDRPEQKGDQP